MERVERGAVAVTLHCLIAEPPVPGRSLPELVDGALEPDEAADLHAASLQDTMVAAERSGGELMVTYPPPAQASEQGSETAAPEVVLRDLAETALTTPGDVRYEALVGSDFEERAGNAVPRLLDEDAVDSVAVLRGTAPTLSRTVLDGAAMQLRRHSVVIAPGTAGRDAYLGLSDAIDFEGAFEAPEVESLAARGVDAGHEVAILSMQPVVSTPGGLLDVVAIVRARRLAGLAVPEYTSTAIEDLELAIDTTDGRRRLTRAG